MRITLHAYSFPGLFGGHNQPRQRICVQLPASSTSATPSTVTTIKDALGQTSTTPAWKMDANEIELMMKTALLIGDLLKRDCYKTASLSTQSITGTWPPPLTS